MANKPRFLDFVFSLKSEIVPSARFQAFANATLAHSLVRDSFLVAQWQTRNRVIILQKPAEVSMSEVTRILSEIEQGDTHAADQLLPFVYNELRKLAAQKLAQEKPGQTLQATALVHEAYVRLVDTKRVPRWDSRGHFFAAAAEAMRRILIEQARRKGTRKHGGDVRRVDLNHLSIAGDDPSDELLALDEALAELEEHDPQAAQLVKLRYFAGLSHQQAAEVLGISRRAADRIWALARAWLYQRIGNK
jgi:RNA polymerase sigma factor (TIGR02999 family)